MTVRLRTAPDTARPTPASEPAAQADAPDIDHIIDAAGLDSFPASDPPGWWSGVEPPRTSSQNEEDTT